MYKELLSTDRVGLVINTEQWLTGVCLSRHLLDYSGRRGDLLEIGFLCLTLYIAIKRRDHNG